MRLGRGGEETTPVEILTDDEGWADATPVTTPARRGRWPEAMLVVAVIAVVLGIGATSGSDGEDAADMPRQPTTTAARRSRTTPPPHPAPTTTTWPQQVAGGGPVLGAGVAQTGTALVVAEERSIAVLDLDTGHICRTDADGAAIWSNPGQQWLRDEVEVNDDFGRARVVDVTCDLRPAERQVTRGWVVATTEDATWTMEEGPVQRLTKRADDGGIVRTIDVPAYSGMVADSDWLVAAVAGEMVAIDLHDDREIALGSGHPMGIGGGRLLAIRCERLECALVMIEVESGRVRTLDVPMPIQWEPVLLSPDGRWLSYGVVSYDGMMEAVLADLETATVTPTRGGPCVFTADSHWLLCVRPSVIEAVSLDDGHIVNLSNLFDRPTNGFAALRAVGAR